MVTNRRLLSVAGALAFGVVILSGCATKGFVRREVEASRGYTDAKFAEAKTRADEAWAKASLAERLGSGDYTEVSVHQVQFAFDDFRLDGSAQGMLDQMASQLSSHPNFGLEIRGYADATGTDRYNFRLGRDRAEEVLRYMMLRHNVPTTRVATVSFGEENPIADNESEEGRSQNRRVQVRLLEINTGGTTPVSMIP